MDITFAILPWVLCVTHVLCDGMTPEDRQVAVDKHNEIRRQQTGANVELMTYSCEIETKAQCYADQCSWEHSSKEYRNYNGRAHGENLAFYTGTADSQTPISDQVQSWADEKAFWDYNARTCSQPPCLHYTAIAWATTNTVGCGIAFCPSLADSGGVDNAWYVVCQYAPQGNINMQTTKEYISGPVCSQCPSDAQTCCSGLCADSCNNTVPDSCPREDCSSSNTVSIIFSVMMPVLCICSALAGFILDKYGIFNPRKTSTDAAAAANTPSGQEDTGAAWASVNYLKQ